MDDLSAFLNEHTARTVHPLVSEFATALAHLQPGALAVLAYGSALRDSSPAETLIDYYVLVERPEHISGNPLLRWLGNRVPPNVHYAEHPLGGAVARSKYAVMTFDRFNELVSPETANPYLWARFCQPSCIVWLRDEAMRGRLVQAVRSAVRTAYGHGLFLSPASPWQSLFENTYRTELRPESSARAALIVEADAEYYQRLTALLKGCAPIASSWFAKRAFGKLWSIARLAKAAFTFQGGADYAAWKIERHSGVKIEVTDWQRNHPFLAGVMMLPKLLGKKGLR